MTNSAAASIPSFPSPNAASLSAQAGLARRFGGVARLYGAAALARFERAHVCVIGVGGVGSWAVEALARSAIGHITMIDLDNLAESNVNRQIHALTDTLGMAKVTALAERIAQINPACRVTQVEQFLTADTLATMIGAHDYDFIIDAIDDVPAKTALIAYCRSNRLRLVTIGGAGGQIDPTRIEVRDLCRTEQEPLLAKVRKRLRAEHGFPRGTKNKFHIDAVFSTEPLRFPEIETAPAHANTSDADDSERDAPAAAGISGLNCAGFGSAVVVTGAFGLVAAAHVLRLLAADVAVAAAVPASAAA